MTEKELKKLNRYQLLELIILQTEQLDSLKLQLQETQTQLEAQQIRVSQAGSIAEAALQLNDIFEAAQSTADLYLETVRLRDEKADEIEAAARQRLLDAEEQAVRIVENAQQHAEDILRLARQQSAEILEKAYISQSGSPSEPVRRGLFGKKREK